MEIWLSKAICLISLSFSFFYYNNVRHSSSLVVHRAKVGWYRGGRKWLVCAELASGFLTNPVRQPNSDSELIRFNFSQVLKNWFDSTGSICRPKATERPESEQNRINNNVRN